jgi:hypothetical protein
MLRFALALAVVTAGLTAELAQAGCCTLRKTDATLPTVTLRVCEPSSAGVCGSLLFAGPLSIGESQNVCSAQSTLVYQEAAPGQPFGALVEAVCDGADVEF